MKTKYPPFTIVQQDIPGGVNQIQVRDPQGEVVFSAGWRSSRDSFFALLSGSQYIYYPPLSKAYASAEKVAVRLSRTLDRK